MSNRSELEKLLLRLEQEVIKAEKFSNSAHTSYLQVNEGASASPSASGDREHAKNASLINKQNLNKLTVLFDEIKQAVSNKPPDSATPISFIEVEFPDGTKDSFYLSREPIHLQDFKFVSTSSPLGIAILDKHINDKFEYEVGNKTLAGHIISIN